MIDGGRADTVRRLFVVIVLVEDDDRDDTPGVGDDERERYEVEDPRPETSLIGAKPTDGGEALNTV